MKQFLVLLLLALALYSPCVHSDADTTDAEPVAAEADPVPTNTEKHEFQAEVNRLMDIIIHSLYSNKDIFLRELISNASDALEKVRFLMLTDKALQEAGEEQKIQIEADTERNTLTIRDTGIGMTKPDLINNLGTVARSGTTKFLEASSKSGDDAMGLIGQFGVGFYSAYLVAEKVTVTTKHVNDTQLVWESDAKSSFVIYEDPTESLGAHGTAITLHMREDEMDYLKEDTLKKIVDKYSEFINFPIYLRTSKTITEEVEVEKEETEDEPQDDEDEDAEKPETDGEELDVTDADEDEGPQTKKVEKTVFEWELVNKNKPIWTRSTSDITEEEYTKFFHAISKSDKDPLDHIHFTAEGQVQFRGLIYVPSVAPHDLYDKYYSGKNQALKLYVRRVLLADEIDKDFLPQYLNFVKGIIDSDDLPINVSRETLQKSRVLRLIGRNIVKRVLKMLEKLAEKEAPEKEKEEGEEDEDADKEKDEDEEETEKPYDVFWGQFGRSIKLGVLEDEKNKDRLIDLLRFTSTKSPKKLVSLAEYVERMPETQNHIYYISGPEQSAIENSPLLEQLKKRDLEVLFFVDNLDEYLTSSVTEYDGKKLMSATKEGIEFGEDTEEEKELQKDLDADFETTLKWMNAELGDKVGKVVVSSRLEDTPAVLVSTRWGWSANMERIMRAQAMSQQFENQRFMIGSRTLEINPNHPIVLEIKKRIEAENTEGVGDMVHLLYDSALINSGFVHEHISDFVKRVNGIMAANLNVEPNPSGERYIPPKRPVEETEDEVEEEEDEDEEEDDGAGEEDTDAEETDKDEL